MHNLSFESQARNDSDNGFVKEPQTLNKRLFDEKAFAAELHLAQALTTALVNGNHCCINSVKTSFS